jgi:hypothetical protein
MNIYGNKTKKKDEELQFSYPAYEKSDAVKQAETQLQQHISAQPSDFQSQYQDKMKNLMTQMENRPSFQYDADGDALYQYYKDRYIHNGQRAMEDTMGQAAALTGGYGSSYAQKVGQQAYQSHLRELTDVIPELYQLAYERYQDRSDALYRTYQAYDEQEKQVAQFKAEESKALPADLDYESIVGLRLEARQKLAQIKPLSIGQAGRISGVSPADIAVLLIWLEQQRANKM